MYKELGWALTTIKIISEMENRSVSDAAGHGIPTAATITIKIFSCIVQRFPQINFLSFAHAYILAHWHFSPLRKRFQTASFLKGSPLFFKQCNQRLTVKLT